MEENSLVHNQSSLLLALHHRRGFFYCQYCVLCLLDWARHFLTRVGRQPAWDADGSAGLKSLFWTRILRLETRPLRALTPLWLTNHLKKRSENTTCRKMTVKPLSPLSWSLWQRKLFCASVCTLILHNSMILFYRRQFPCRVECLTCIVVRLAFFATCSQFFCRTNWSLAVEF